jgi:hypothetical protein
MDALKTDAWLTQNKLNPFPIAGSLELNDGRIKFVLAPKAQDGVLGWLEKRTGQEDLKDRVASGEQVVAFDLPVDGASVKWPKTAAGYGMELEAGDATWNVWFAYPAGGAVTQTLSMFSGRKLAKPWKEALKA